MVKEYKIEYRKRDILYTAGLWLISLILPDPHLPYRREFIKKRDFFYLGALLLLPLILSDPLVYLMVLAGIYAILALGLSLFLGYAGQISLGHAAFFGIGAYTTAILTTRYAIPTVGAFWASALVAAVFAYLIGKPILKLKGYFLALATLGFGEIFLVIVKEARSLTGGVSGIFNIPWFSVAGLTFDTYLKQYYLVWVVLIGLVLFAKNLVRSKMGRSLLAVAASEDRGFCAQRRLRRPCRKPLRQRHVHSQPRGLQPWIVCSHRHDGHHGGYGQPLWPHLRGHLAHLADGRARGISGI